MDDPSRHICSIGGLDILFVMATHPEYGPHLKARIDPLMTGVGPVEAAVITTAALSRLAFQGTRPDLIFTLGSAGSRGLEHAEVYQVTSVAYRDMDASALGFAPGQTPFSDHPVVVPLAHRIRDVPCASLSTGAAIVSGSAYDAIAADMVDMETYAVLRAADHFQVPVMGLRGISDGRATLLRYEDWTEYLHVIDERLAKALDLFQVQVEDGSFQLSTTSSGASV